MRPEYIEELANLVDPDQLWRKTGLDQKKLPQEKRRQLDAGIALRRHASDIRRLRDVLTAGRSLLITPLSINGRATKVIDTPPEHKKLRDRK